MTFPIPSGSVPGRPGAGRPRPRAVTVAVALLLAAAAVLVVQVAAYLYDLTTIADMVTRAGRTTAATAAEMDTERAANIDSDVLAAVVLAGGGLILAGSALAVRIGRAGGRMVAIVTGLAVLVCCSGSIGFNLLVPESGSSALRDEVARVRAGEYPAWLAVADYLALLVFPLVIGAIVALLRPSTGGYLNPVYLAYAMPIQDGVADVPAGR